MSGIHNGKGNLWIQKDGSLDTDPKILLDANSLQTLFFLSNSPKPFRKKIRNGNSIVFSFKYKLFNFCLQKYVRLDTRGSIYTVFNATKKHFVANL